MLVLVSGGNFSVWVEKHNLLPGWIYSPHRQTISSCLGRDRAEAKPNLTSTESAQGAAESAMNTHSHSLKSHSYNIRASAVGCQFSFFFLFFFHGHRDGSILVFYSMWLQKQPSPCVILLAGVNLNYNRLVMECSYSLISRFSRFSFSPPPQEEEEDW